LTPQQVDFYRDNGYVLVSGIFTAEELDRLEQAFDGIIERRLSRRAQLDATWGGEKWRQRYGAGNTLILHTHDLQAYDAQWSRVLVHDRLTLAFAQLVGSPNVQLHHTKLFQKPPEKGSPFPMHQDAPYFSHERH